MNNLPFTLNQLIIFQTIANGKSLKETAQILYISQSAVSSQMHKLERDLCLTLFKKQEKSIGVSTIGELIVFYSDIILVLCEEISKVLVNLKNLENLRIVIGSSQKIETFLALKMIKVTHKRYPKINLHLKVTCNSPTFWNVTSGHIDILITKKVIPKAFINILEVIARIEEELILVLSNEHPFSNLKQVKSEDLYSLKFITLDRNMALQKINERILRESQINISKLSIEARVNSTKKIVKLVQADVGVAFVFLSSVKKEIDLKLITFIRIENTKLKIILSVIISRYNSRAKLLKTFYSEIDKVSFQKSFELFNSP
nr:putative RuBisCO transcriptional regulator [Ishige okamurae]